jgi:hypothetical protein
VCGNEKAAEPDPRVGRRAAAARPWRRSPARARGPHVRLPFLPRVRYRRTILSPAQWRLAADDLPPSQLGQDQRRQALDRWRQRWECPDVVELRDADRTPPFYVLT